MSGPDTFFTLSLSGVRYKKYGIDYSQILNLKYNSDYNIRNTSYSLKLSYIILILKLFPVGWSNPFLKMMKIDQEGLFLKV